MAFKCFFFALFVALSSFSSINAQLTLTDVGLKFLSSDTDVGQQGESLNSFFLETSNPWGPPGPPRNIVANKLDTAKKMLPPKSSLPGITIRFAPGARFGFAQQGESLISFFPETSSPRGPPGPPRNTVGNKLDTAKKMLPPESSLPGITIRFAPGASLSPMN